MNMLEASNPHYNPESLKYTSLRSGCNARTLHELFPRTEGSPIAEIVNESLDLVNPLCQREMDGNPHLIARGSWITRLVLGTPKAYWQLCDAFKNMRDDYDKQLYIGEGELAHSVVEHLADGPDMDFMYLLQAGHTDQEVHSLLANWSRQKNEELRKKGFRIEAAQIPLSTWNGEKDERIYTTLTLQKRNKKKPDDWQAVVRLDFGKEPTSQDELGCDSRLTGMVDMFDACSVAQVAKDSKGRWNLEVEKDNVDILRNRPNVISLPVAYPVNKIIGVSRLVAHDLLYSREPLESFLWRQANEGLTHFTGWWAQPSLTTGNSSFWARVNEKRGDSAVEASLLRREGDIVGWNVLASAVNPFYNLEYARAIELIDQSHIGYLLAHSNDQDRLLRAFAKLWSGFNGDQSRYIKDFRLTVVNSLGEKYQNSIRFLQSNPQDLGPILTIRALKAASLLPSSTPATIETFIDLISPAQKRSVLTSDYEI